jgi:hypothetical protein
MFDFNLFFILNGFMVLLCELCCAKSIIFMRPHLWVEILRSGSGPVLIKRNMLNYRQV